MSEGDVEDQTETTGPTPAQPPTTKSGRARVFRPFFGYYGGKWRDSAKHYPAPLHDTLIEPFAGSAGYSVRHWRKKVVLCEKDPILHAVWSYLLRTSAKEIRELPDVPKDGSVDDLQLPQEARWLIGFWLNRGTSSPRKTPSKWMRSGMTPGSFWGTRVRETIASQVPHIRHWKVHLCSYEECPVTGPATWFIDSPYEKAGRYYRYGSSGINYADLGMWCRQRRGQVIVCENDGAEWLPFKKLHESKTTRAGKRSQEVIWLNDDPGPPEDVDR